MTHRRLIGTIAAIAVFSAVMMSQTPTGQAIFEQALAKERVDGNLPDAIKLYERVVAEFASDRALAAKALMQLGLCYEKLGRDEAVRAYERLVRDFADQGDAVQHARVRLAALKRPASSAAAAATAPAVRAFPRVDRVNELRELSPDGSKAALINYDKGQNLAVYDVASQQTTVLTNLDQTQTSAWVYYASWSPDGRRIAHDQCAISSASVCELRVVTLAGESSLVFRSEAGIRPVPSGWLPDGRALVVMLIRSDRTFSIGLIPTAGGPFTPLRSISGWTGLYPDRPSVSRDGRWIAYGDGGDIHVIDRDGRTAHRVTDHPAEDRWPLWSPDGRHLAFLSDRNGSAALWTVPMQDGQPASEPVRVRGEMGGVYPLLGWTTRGLAYSQYVRTDDIYTVPVDPASGEPNGSPRQIPYRRTGWNVAPGWSPDGKFLAFVSASITDRDRRTLVLLPGGGGEPREFSIPTTNFIPLPGPVDLRWFGDSRGLGFSGVDSRGERVLFRLTLASGEWKTFPMSISKATPTSIEWDVDGSRYFYVQGFNDNPAIVERDLRSDRERIVFRGKPEESGERFSGLRFSPDRRSLAFRSRQGIRVLDIETGQARVVYDNFDAIPTWSPSGSALLVPLTENPGTDKQATDLLLAPVDGSEARRVPLGAELTRLLAPSRGGSRPTIRTMVWSPDGGRLAFVLTSQQLETWVIENPLAVAGATGAARK